MSHLKEQCEYEKSITDVNEVTVECDIKNTMD